MLLYLTDCIRLLAAPGSITWHGHLTASPQVLLLWPTRAPVAPYESRASLLVRLNLPLSSSSGPFTPSWRLTSTVCLGDPPTRPGCRRSVRVSFPLNSAPSVSPFSSQPPLLLLLLLRCPSLSPCPWQPLCLLLSVGLWVRNLQKEKNPSCSSILLLCPVQYLDINSQINASTLVPGGDLDASLTFSQGAKLFRVWWSRPDMTLADDWPLVSKARGYKVLCNEFTQGLKIQQDTKYTHSHPQVPTIDKVEPERLDVVPLTQFWSIGWKCPITLIHSGYSAILLSFNDFILLRENSCKVLWRHILDGQKTTQRRRRRSAVGATTSASGGPALLLCKRTISKALWARW